MTRGDHPLIGKTVIWRHGLTTVVGTATHYDSSDDELYVPMEGTLHGRTWLPADECEEFHEDHYEYAPYFGEWDGAVMVQDTTYKTADVAKRHQETRGSEIARRLRNDWEKVTL